MRVRNKELYLNWKRINIRDGYGFDIFSFCEKWANLMEEELEQGHTVAEIADKTAETAGKEDLSKTMFESAVDILYKCWIHGYELEVYFKKKRRGIFGEKV